MLIELHSTGVGYLTVKHLVRKGATVYLAARNEDKALKALDQLNEENIKAGQVHWLPLALASPKATKEVAEVFMMKENHLDILGMDPSDLICFLLLTAH